MSVVVGSKWVQGGLIVKVVGVHYPTQEDEHEVNSGIFTLEHNLVQI